MGFASDLDADYGSRFVIAAGDSFSQLGKCFSRSGGRLEVFERSVKG